MTTESRPVAAPVPVRTAHLLWLVVAAVVVVSAVLSEIADPTTGPGNVPGVVLYVVAVVVVLVIIGLIVLSARKMLVGRNWARIVLLILGVLSLIDLATTFGKFGGGLAVTVSVLNLLGDLVAIVAVVLSFLPAANPWFRHHA